ncbi:MAG TPA: SDR family NAD(P)-dependent oxidoreductase [Candidatus Acidoferrum sp.]|nr:SDR family NAD(P)-dependent oxidoreductase [Candidatus Acidoferrum sp.]
MAKRFAGKAILVTGGGGGIGRAASLAFASEGGRVLVADTDAIEGERTSALVREAGGDSKFVEVDVSHDAQCVRMVDVALSAFGRLDIAFNNAGVGGSGFALADEEEATFDRMIAINLKGVFNSMRREVPAMLKSGGGTIVNTASVAGIVGNPGLSSYCAAKHECLDLHAPPRSTTLSRGCGSTRCVPARPGLGSWRRGSRILRSSAT